MASVITLAFEGWKAQEAATGKPVLLNEFVFANVPNLDPTKPIDRNEKLPPANQIVHRQAVNKAGLVSENAVAYSVTLGADVGDFDFNWIGLLNKESGTIAMITHAPIQKKLKTQNGQQGNVLIRSFLLEFNGAAEETQIKTSAETWQIDFTARLTGMDEMQRLINVDNYGAAAFFNDGFEVTRSGEQFTVKKGLGYVGGLRGQLEQNQILNGLRNTKIYADFSYQGNIVSKWNTVIKITSAATLNNYVDAAGFTHQVFAIASIDASGNVKDLRPKGALSSQSISELEKKVNDGLGGKQDKGDYAIRGESYTKTESNLKFQPTGNYQPAGNYAPAGDYATNKALNEGLNKKFNTSDIVHATGTSKTQIMSQDAATKAFLQAGDFGLGSGYGKSIAGNDYNNIALSGFYGGTGVGGINPPPGQICYGGVIAAFRFSNEGFIITAHKDDVAIRVKTAETGWGGFFRFYTENNTQTDHNGNVKIKGNLERSDYLVGAPIPWPQTTAPAGYLVCNGQSFNKTTYPLLAKAYPTGVLPDLRGEFLRGVDAGRGIDTGRAVLSAQGDTIRNITGEFANNGNTMSEDSYSTGVGAFAKKRSSNVRSNREVDWVGCTYSFDASRVVPTANENRPRNVAFLYIVRAA
ncbi:phage tail protein [Providencia rettgeri]|uniref:phage tail-collar fiber domain-containing protein n=1 Tax=Providencia rettgeri TaxID=587 RepID=UPI001373C35C|nr:phage tail protein [Providencia rettgeri]BBU94761.1 hypothetical protein BML2496_06440 [Providencia rettgeri]